MTGNPTLDKVLLGINGVVVLLATGLIIYSHSLTKPATDTGTQFGQMIEGSIYDNSIAPVSMKEAVVNLYSREKRLRFLNLKMDIGIYSEEDRGLVEKLKPVILDTLIDIAGHLPPKELNSVTGKILFESRVKTKINNYAGKKVIKKIYFSKFIIQ